MAYVSDKDPRIARAIRSIFADYGDTVSVEAKNKSLMKYGRNKAATATTQMVWIGGGLEVLPTGNNIDVAVSTSVSDTVEVTIEGHTISGSDLTFVTQNITLTGTTNKALTTPLYRATRVFNNSGTNLVGVVTVKDNGTSNHLVTDSAVEFRNQSLKCATSMSSQDYWIITQIGVGVDKTQSRSVAFSMQIRQSGKTFRTAIQLENSSNNGTIINNLDPCIIVPKNADMRMLCTSSGTSTGVSAFVNGHLALVQ